MQDLKYCFFNNDSTGQFVLIKLVKFAGKYQILRWTNSGGVIIEDFTNREPAIMNYNEVVSMQQAEHPDFKLIGEVK